MNAAPSPDAQADPQPSNAQDDETDDIYSWIGYESAHPLSLSDVDRAACASTAERWTGC